MMARQKQGNRRVAGLVVLGWVGLLALGALGGLSACNPAKNVKAVFADQKGVAIRGYDPVAYFTKGKPTQGVASISHKWGGATWYFQSAAHRDSFKSNPEKYAPAYGGYCAWAVSRNYTAPTQPDAWKIVKGKLYLNYNKDIAKRWSKDIPGNITKANKNWPRLHK